MIPAALAAAVLGLSPGSASAATASTPYDIFGVNPPELQTNGLFGQRLEDANVGSGVTDVFASSYNADQGAMTGAGEVTLIDSRTHAIRYEIRSPEPQKGANFGFYIANVGDINGNGGDELAIGAPGENLTAAGVPCDVATTGCNANQGKVYIIEGSTGQVLFSLNSPDPQNRPGAGGGFGSRIGNAGDVNGDGVPDIIVGASGYDQPADCRNISPIPTDCRRGEGAAYIFSGKDGSLIRRLNLPVSDQPAAPCSPSTGTVGPPPPCGAFGGTVQGLGDVDGDGVPDQFVAAYSLRATPTTHGRVYIFSGKDGHLLTRIDAPESGATQYLGLQDAARNTPGDVNGDGYADIYVNAFTQNGPGGAGEGKAWVFNGKASVAAGRGVLLYEIKDPTPGPSKAFGFLAARTDYNKDGVPDIALGGLGGVNNQFWVFDGRDGSLLKTFDFAPGEYQPGVPGNSGSSLGAGLRGIGDINGDCEPDFVTGAAYQDVLGVQDAGKVYFYASHGPSTCLVPPPPVVVPVVTSFGMTTAKFTVGSAATPTTGAAAAVKHTVKHKHKHKHKAHKAGTTFTYTLSLPATVRIAISQLATGQRKGTRCVAPTAKSKAKTKSKAKKCTRTIARGTLTRSSHAGFNRVRFSGRIGSKALHVGRYRATLTATGRTGKVSNSRTASFTIVAR